MSVPFCTPTNNGWEFLLLHTFAFGVVSVLNLSHPKSGIQWYRIVVLIYNFLMICMISIFSYAYLPSGKTSIQAFHVEFNQIVHFLNVRVFPPWHQVCGVFSNTNQFSNSLASTECSNKSVDFRHYLPGASLRSHKWKGSVSEFCLHLRCRLLMRCPSTCTFAGTTTS